MNIESLGKLKSAHIEIHFEGEVKDRTPSGERFFGAALSTIDRGDFSSSPASAGYTGRYLARSGNFPPKVALPSNPLSYNFVNKQTHPGKKIGVFGKDFATFGKDFGVLGKSLPYFVKYLAYEISPITTLCRD